MKIIKAPITLKISFIITFFLFFSFKLCCDEFEDFEIRQNYQEDGINISVKYPENISEDPVSAFYRFFIPVNNLYKSGKIKKGESIFIPFGAELCVWAQSSSGKLSETFHLIAEAPDQQKLLNVLSPQEGVWNEVQKLIIKAPAKTQIMYSIDGSDPSEFGLLYTEPIILEKDGKIDLKIRVVGESGLITEKEIKYTVDPSGYPSPKISDMDYNEDNLQNGNSYDILNWYFINFYFESPVYYLIKDDEKNDEPSLSELLNVYDGPIFTDRTKDRLLYWTNKDFQDGKINKIFLPRKPLLSWVPNEPVNRNIELNFDDNRYTYFFEVGDGKTFLLPTKKSERFTKDGSMIFDSGIRQERFFDVKIRAFYEDRFHGEFKTAFTIDKLPPERPEAVFNPPVSPTNTSVKINLKPVSDAEIVTKIEPPLFTSLKNEITLTGSLGEKTVYSVHIYSKDKAGNKSAPITKEFIIDRNAVYVDYNSKVKNSDGNPLKPFSSIYEAVDSINNISFLKTNTVSSEKWKIYVRGDCILNEPILITRNIKISSASSRSSIHVSKNAGFIVIGANFEIENCDIFRREPSEEPREVPVLYADKAEIKLNNVKLQAVEGGPILKSFYAHLDISDSTIISEQSNHCLIFNINNSSAVFKNLDFTGAGFSIAAISSVNSIIEMDDIRSSFTPEFTARFLEAWNSEISLGRLNLIRLPEAEANNDTAVWYNKNSKMDIKYQPIIQGFSKSIMREP